MSMSGTEKLLSLLFGEEQRELVNIKFLPGLAEGIAADALCAEAHGALMRALAVGAEDAPPRSAVAQRDIAELVSDL